MTDAFVLRNLDALAKHQPDVAVRLKAIRQTETLLERDADGVVSNIRIGAGLLYGTAAQEWAAGQVVGFLNKSKRIIFSNTKHCNIDRHFMPLHAKMIDYCINRLGGPLSSAPVVDVGYLFVFGVGLGYHIEELMLSTAARNLVLVEPIQEFLLHSLSAVDWTKLYRLASERGQKLHIITDRNPTEITRRMEQCLVHQGTDFLDGSYFFFHYHSWELQEVHSEFALRVRRRYYSTGFFGDEKKMMTNACENMRRNDFFICEDKPFIHQSTPLFIVGSGPSLDNDIEYIRQWRDKVILISSGTSLGILLKHGLRPDIHTEMENGPQIYPILASLREKYGFAGIRLGASLTVDPAVGELFDKRWLFLRTALSPSRLLASFHKGLFGSDPTVSNASFSIAAATGFSDVYLFGVDCGYREGTGERHHSQHSIYFTDDKPEGTDEIIERHDRTLPGNFGGLFQTQWTFDLTVRAIVEVKRRYRGMTLFNCSDGARIDGAQPMAAEAIDLSHLPDRHERVLHQIERQMTHYQPGELLRKLDREQLVVGCREFSDAILEAFALARRQEDGFWELHQHLRAVYNAHRTDCLGGIAVAGASVLNMLRGAAFYGVRIMDPKARRQYFQYILDELPAPVSDMLEQAAALYETLLADEMSVSTQRGVHDHPELVGTSDTIR